MKVKFPDPIRAYDDLVDRRPDLFRNPENALVEVVTERRERQTLESELKERFDGDGQPEHWGLAGKFYEDPWLIVVRDIVRFAGSVAGTYHRIILKDGHDSVVVLPRLGDQFVLVHHFRHALREWSLELPRGRVDPKGTIEDAATAELQEEMGAEILSLRRMGMVQGDTSLTNNPMHVLEAQLSAIGEPNRTEGIESLVCLSLDEIKGFVQDGKIWDVLTIATLAYAIIPGLTKEQESDRRS